LPISEINFTTTGLRILDADEPVGWATGFFYRGQDSREFLITNRHVVIDEGKQFRPTALQMLLHRNADSLAENHPVVASLYGTSGDPLWLEHPDYEQTGCDLVAIPMCPEILQGYNHALFRASLVVTFAPNATDVPGVNPFGDVVIVGYPLGFHDDINNLPVYRKAMIASQFGVNFRRKPYFLVDANLHPGTSGSPVVNSHHTLFSDAGTKEGYTLFGIHSAQHVVGDQPLGLNVVWYSSLIVDITQR